MKRMLKPAELAAGVGLLAAAALAATAGASMVDLTLEESACIADPADAGNWRALLRFEIPDVLVGATVDLAVLRVVIPIDCDEEREISVEAFPVTCAWSVEGVVWGEGWQSGDGVWEEHRGSISSVVAGERSAMSVDVTHIVGMWLEAGDGAEGLVLKPLLGGPHGALVAPPSGPVLRVRYTGGRRHEPRDEGH